VKSAGLGRTFIWQADSPSPVVTEQYRDEAVRGDVFRVRHTRDEKVFDPYCGLLLEIALRFLPAPVGGVVFLPGPRRPHPGESAASINKYA
jgi:hypothetical protein